MTDRLPQVDPLLEAAGKDAISALLGDPFRAFCALYIPPKYDVCLIITRDEGGTASLMGSLTTRTPTEMVEAVERWCRRRREQMATDAAGAAT